MLADLGLVIHDYVQTWVVGLEWDKYATTIRVVGHILTGTFFMLRLVQDTLLAGVGTIAAEADAFDLSKSSWLRQDDVMMSYKDVLFRDWNNGGGASAGSSTRSNSSAIKVNQLINHYCFGMLLLSMSATYKFLYGNFKSYTLFYLKNLGYRQSSSIKKIDVKAQTKSLGDNSSFKELLIALYNTLIGQENDDFGDDQNEIVDTEYYELNKWVPSKLLLGVIVSFSPTVLYFLRFTSVSFLSVIPVLIHQIVLHLIILERYETRIEDDLLLTTEFIKGYDKRYVRQQESKLYQDVMLDTIDLDNGGFVKFISTDPSKLFKRHRINGDLVIEKYNKKNDTFENVTKQVVSNKPTKNKIYQLPIKFRNKSIRKPSMITLKNRMVNSQQNSKEVVANAKPIINDFYDNDSVNVDHFVSDNDSDNKPKFFPATPLRKQRR